MKVLLLLAALVAAPAHALSLDKSIFKEVECPEVAEFARKAALANTNGVRKYILVDAIKELYNTTEASRSRVLPLLLWTIDAAYALDSQPKVFQMIVLLDCYEIKLGVKIDI